VVRAPLGSHPATSEQQVPPNGAGVPIARSTGVLYPTKAIAPGGLQSAPG